MARGRTKVRIKKGFGATKDDINDINNLFNQMTGISNADSDVLVPKLIKLHKCIDKYVKYIDILCKCEYFKDYQWCTELQDVVAYVRAELLRDDFLTLDADNPFDVVKCIQQFTVEEVNVMYKALKDHKFIKDVIMATAYLTPHESSITNTNELSDKFIIQEVSMSVKPFPFTDLDLWKLWEVCGIQPHAKKYMLSVIGHLYETGLVIYDIVTSPDIDIERFSYIIIDRIAALRKEIRGCNQAFDVIERSVKVLEKNFQTYYRDSVEASNSSYIIERFISDLATTDTNVRLTSQFNRIVAHLRTKHANVNDKRLDEMFNLIDKQFVKINRYTESLDIPLDVSSSQQDESSKQGEDSVSK